MNYAELQTLFKQRLNRRDITQTLVEGFIKSSIQRTQRLLRTPGSEVGASYTFAEGERVFPIPGDYLLMVGMSVDGGAELVRTSLSETLRLNKSPGVPQVYARNRDVFVIGPRPVGGSTLDIVYQSNFSILANETDTNWLTEIAPDIIVNGALSEACMHYSDPRKSAFEDTYVTAIVDLNNQAQADELTNAQVEQGSSFDFYQSEM